MSAVALPSHRLSCRHLYLAALCCWVASLALTGLSFEQTAPSRGLNILLMGWLGPLVGTWAWLANPLFIWALIRLHKGRQAELSALLALSLAASTWWFTQYAVEPRTTPIQVYGYGWGTVLWWLAMALLVAAAGSLDSDEQQGWYWMRPAGLLLAILVLSGSGYMAIDQRSRASTAEQQALKGLAFKRATLCTHNIAAPIAPLPGLRAPLLIRQASGYNDDSNPLLNIEQLLGWGVPSVRFGARDYRASGLAGDGILMSTPAYGELGAILTLSGGKENLEATLTTPDDRLIMRQSWTLRQRAASCPEFSWAPGADAQPRALLNSALGLTGNPGATAGKAQDNWPKSVQVQALPAPPPQSGTATRTEPARRCSTRTGWLKDLNDEQYSLRHKAVLLLDSTRYYLPRFPTPGLLCEGDDLYLYTFAGRLGVMEMNLSKRSLQNMRSIWKTTATVDFSTTTPNVEPDKIELLAVTLTAGELQLQVRDRVTGKSADIRIARPIEQTP